MAGFDLTGMSANSGYGPAQMQSLSDYLGQFTSPLSQAQGVSPMIGSVPGTGTWNMLDGNVGAGLQQGPSGFGLNLDTGKLALSGLQTLSSLWGALQSNKLAKEQLNLSREMSNANLNNQIKTYNTGLTDRINSRAKVNGQDQAMVDEYLALNKLSR